MLLSKSLSILVVLSAIAAAQEPKACTTHTTAGRYVVTCSGYISPAANAPLLPAALLATTNADQEGTFSGSGDISIGGTIVKQTVIGTEKLSSDCTGSITYHTTVNGNPAPDIHFDFVVGDKGQKIYGISTDPGTVLSCTLTKISKESSPE
jgi:hypothetical protein